MSGVGLLGIAGGEVGLRQCLQQTGSPGARHTDHTHAECADAHARERRIHDGILAVVDRDAREQHGKQRNQHLKNHDALFTAGSGDRDATDNQGRETATQKRSPDFVGR